ncbi:MAG: hypothetical protein NVSMB2_18760 [Chloroflexota bacterium]
MSQGAGFPARPSRGGDTALWVASILLFFGLAMLILGGSREPGVPMVVLCTTAVVLLIVGGGLLTWALAYHRLRYVLTDAAICVEWLGETTVVPYSAILGIYTGQRLGGHATAGLPRWPGINVGAARVRGVGRLRYFATSTDQSDLTLITVEHGGLVISAAEPQAFRAALIEHVEASGEQPTPEAWYQTPTGRPPWTALRDLWLIACVVVAALTTLAILLVIALRFSALPAQITMHFDATGQASQVASKYDLLRLPFFGIVLVLVDWALGAWLHARDRLLARLLWLGGALVQLVLLIGIVRLVV